MTTINLFIGQKIKEFRQAKNITQAELANMINMEPTNLSKIEKGNQFPRENTMNKILKALDTDLNTLLSYKKDFNTLTVDKKQLIKDINNILNSSKTEDIRFFYQVLSAYNNKFLN